MNRTRGRSWNQGSALWMFHAVISGPSILTCGLDSICRLGKPNYLVERFGIRDVISESSLSKLRRCFRCFKKLHYQFFNCLIPSNSLHQNKQWFSHWTSEYQEYFPISRLRDWAVNCFCRFMPTFPFIINDYFLLSFWWRLSLVQFNWLFQYSD